LKTVLITGAAGFCGRYLAEILGNNGNYVTYGISRRIPDELCIQHPRVIYKACDLKDYASVLDVLKKTTPDYIFHLAAESSVASSWKNPINMMTNNIVSQINLFEAVLELELSTKIIVACSSEEYGLVKPSDLPANENCCFNPLSSYAVSKVSQDMLAFQYYKSYNMNIVRVRAFNLTGPRRPPNYALSSFAKQITDIEKGLSKNPILVGNLNVERDFTDVRDAVKAYHLIAQKAKPGEVYNLCSGKAYKLIDLLYFLLSLAKVDVKVEIDESKFRPSDIPVIVGDNTKIMKEINWAPEIDIHNSLKDLLDYWRSIDR
jgi:GDP-4-dehydro-6-deoxy-D-mannose reductase